MTQQRNNAYNSRRRLMTRNGVSIAATADGGTRVVCRQNTAGALTGVVPLSTDETAEIICNVLRSTKGTRQEKAAAVIAALKETCR